MNSKKKKNLESDLNKIEEIETEKKKNIPQKLVLKDASEDIGFSGRSNVLILKFAEKEENKGAAISDTMEEIAEDNEVSKEELEESKDLFFEIIKLDYKEFDFKDIKRFVMR